MGLKTGPTKVAYGAVDEVPERERAVPRSPPSPSEHCA